MKLEAGQVWQLDTQEEFDAFVELKSEQDVRWSYTRWTFETLMKQDKSIRLEISSNENVKRIYNSSLNATHYGKDLLNETKWQEVEREENIGSENGTLIVEQNIETKELRITRGFFTGTLDEFEARVKLKPEGDKHRVVYKWLIEKYKRLYPDYKKVAYVVKLNDKIYYADNGVTIHEEEACKWADVNGANALKALYRGTVEEVEVWEWELKLKEENIDGIE